MVTRTARTTAAVISALVLAACEPGQMGTPAAQPAATPDSTTTVIAPRGGPEAVSAAQVLANVFQDNANQNLGGGVNIRNARAEGPLLVIEIEFPTAARAYSARETRTAAAQLQRDFQRGLCGIDILRAFIQIGGEIGVEFYGRDGGRFAGIDQLRYSAC